MDTLQLYPLKIDHVDLLQFFMGRGIHLVTRGIVIVFYTEWHRPYIVVNFRCKCLFECNKKFFNHFCGTRCCLYEKG